MKINTVSIVGLGALGILFGQRLADYLPRGSVRVVADKARSARYQRTGVLCNDIPCNFTYVTPSDQNNPADLLIFAVKATALSQAIADAKNQVGPHTILLSLLNGISSEEALGQALGEEKVVYAVAQGMDATRVNQSVRYSNAGKIVFGEKDGRETPRIRALHALFEAAGVPCEVSADILRAQWNKLMLNVGVNQATAVYGTNYAGVCAPGPARQTMVAAMQEVRAVAAYEGVVLTQEDVDRWLVTLDTLAPDGEPSMRQDVKAHRPTEVELFAGTVCALGKKHNVATPVNDFLYQRICALTAGA